MQEREIMNIVTVRVNGRAGIIAGSGKGPNDGKSFVLFNDDDASESAAGWFVTDSLDVTGTVPATF